MTLTQQQRAARDFAQRWQGKGYEKGESQSFWLSLLSEVFGVEHPDEWITFEKQVHLDHTSFIDAFIPRTHVMIEQKSIDKDLGAPIRQSDGSLLNPFQQAKRYIVELKRSEHPRWIVTCNFREFWVYDTENPNGEPLKIILKNLEKEYHLLRFLVEEKSEQLRREMEVSVKAGELVGIIYDKLLEQYIDKDSPETLRSLNILCVRLVFCLYAEDAGLFPSHTAFHDYLYNYKAGQFRSALIRLFEVLDTPLADRDPYLDEDLAAFPYVNGGLFGARSSSPAQWDADGSSAKRDTNPSAKHTAGEPPASRAIARIEQTAQAILDARAKYPDSSLADLYDENTMPPELRRAHQDNDRAVMAAYGFSPKMTESECVAELFKLYQELTK